MSQARSPRERIASFNERFELRMPVLEAPMAGLVSPARSVKIMQAGGMGAMGAVLSTAPAIDAWVQEVRTASAGAFQLNLWIPEPITPKRDPRMEAEMRDFLVHWGPPVDEAAGAFAPPDFQTQCDALIAARPAAVSSIMGLFPRTYVQRLKAAHIPWLATVTTLAEAQEAHAAGADALIVQGVEAGGHRGTFVASRAGSIGVGLMTLIPQLADRIDLPVIASGGIADGRAAAAAIILGASAVQLGTALLRAPESGIPPAWSDALRDLSPESTIVTPAFSGRHGRGIETAFVRAMQDPGAPAALPYPVQRGLTLAMRVEASRTNDIQGMQAWAGQAAASARDVPVATIVQDLWSDADTLIP